MTFFPFPWADLTCELEWLSSVARPYSTEHRWQLSPEPRLVLRPSFFLTQADVYRAQTIFDIGNGVLDVPDWRYAQQIEPGFAASSLTFSVDASFFINGVGDTVVIYENATTYTLATITDVSLGEITVDAGPSTPYGHALVAPVFEGVATRPLAITTKEGVAYNANAEFTVTDYKDLSNFFTSDEWGGKYVSQRDTITQSHTVRTVVSSFNVDAKVGSIVSVRTRDRNDYFDMLHFDAQYGLDMLETEAILHTLAGRVNSFWKPSWMPDYTLYGTASAGQFYINVEPLEAGFTPEAIAIELVDGSTEYHNVVSVTQNTGYSVLTLSTALANTLTPSTLLTLSHMRLSRLDTDVVSMKFDEVGGCKLSAATVGVTA